MPIIKIVSGGQTGADRGGLDAAIWCKLPHGGWCPKGRRADDGTIPARYELRETPYRNYLARTEANVVDSDATVIFSYGDIEGGSLRTAEFAKKHNKPWLHIDLGKMDRQQAVDAVVEWLKAICPTAHVLNVAGSRESKSPGIRGVVKARMIDVISKANGTLFYEIADDAEPNDDGDATNSPDGMDDTTMREIERQMDQMSKEASIILHHPKTIEDAVRIVLDSLSPDAKDEVRKSDNGEEFSLRQYSGLARWVRNSMIHQNQNIVDLYADFQRGCREGKWDGVAEADDVSGVIVELVWDSLHGKTPNP